MLVRWGSRSCVFFLLLSARATGELIGDFCWGAPASGSPYSFAAYTGDAVGFYARGRWAPDGFLRGLVLTTSSASRGFPMAGDGPE